jgi:hypothetical protein
MVLSPSGTRETSLCSPARLIALPNSSRNALHPRGWLLVLRMPLRMSQSSGYNVPGHLFHVSLRSLVLLRTLVGFLPLGSRNAGHYMLGG